MELSDVWQSAGDDGKVHDLAKILAAATDAQRRYNRVTAKLLGDEKAAAKLPRLAPEADKLLRALANPAPEPGAMRRRSSPSTRVEEALPLDTT